MTASTPTYGIVYAVSTDALCDGAAITEQMAESIETALSGLAVDIPRLTVVPYVVLGAVNTAPVLAYPTGGAPNQVFEMPWDSVLADTDNFADFPVDGDPTMDWAASQNPTGVYLAGAGFADYTTVGVTFANYQTKDLVSTTLSPIALQIPVAPTVLSGQMNEQGLIALNAAATNTQITCEVSPVFSATPGDSVVGSQTGTFGYFIWMRDFS